LARFCLILLIYSKDLFRDKIGQNHANPVENVSEALLGLASHAPFLGDCPRIKKSATINNKAILPVYKL
jgi:hypothetical protein